MEDGDSIPLDEEGIRWDATLDELTGRPKSLKFSATTHEHERFLAQAIELLRTSDDITIIVVAAHDEGASIVGLGRHFEVFKMPEEGDDDDEA